jgi:uncharacterized protein
MVRLNDVLLKRADIKRIAANHGANHVTLFGSVVRGEETPTSDIDLLVDLEPNRSLLDRIALKQELEDFLGRPVDVINRKSLDPAIREQILKDRVEL